MSLLYAATAALEILEAPSGLKGRCDIEQGVAAGRLSRARGSK